MTQETPLVTEQDILIEVLEIIKDLKEELANISFQSSCDKSMA